MIQSSNLNCYEERIDEFFLSRNENVTYLDKGGCGTVYKAIWTDGYIRKWDYEKKQWQRVILKVNNEWKSFINNEENSGIIGYSVALKSLKNSLRFSENFLEEVKLHLQCQISSFDPVRGSSIVPIYGITYDPNSCEYMVVMEYVSKGNLRNNLKNIMKEKWNIRLERLYFTTVGLAA
ncbi:10721_t:CDS:2, partial [Dentiscutata erythropus]